MRFLILAENSGTDLFHWKYYRSMAANELRKRITLAGHECTVIEWFRSWNKADLIKIVDKYFEGAQDPVIAISSPFDFNFDNLIYLDFLLEYAKRKYPNLKVIQGGQRYFKPKLSDRYKHVDIEFLSRSIGMFDDWLFGKDVTKYAIHHNPLVLVNNNVNRVVDTPLLYELYEDDFLTEHETLGFEISVGCKFNCAFCDYTLRNAKNVILNESTKLKKLFVDAYEKYGIKNYYCIDDTLNETEEKLEILYEAIRDLNFKPKISAYVRLDLLNKPRQRELFKKINLSGAYFGIESFNPEVSKAVRKKTGIVNVYDTLEFVRDECSETFTTGSFIVGLRGDTYESIMNGFEKAAKEKLFDALQIYPYAFSHNEEIITDVTSISEIEKNPEKFGYEIIRSPATGLKISWSNDWSDSESAEYIAQEIREKHKGDFFILSSDSELAALRSVNLIQNKGTAEDKINFNQIGKRAVQLSNQFKQQYIERKKNQLGI